MLIKDYRDDPRTKGSLAFTMKEDYVGSNPSGWVILGEVHEDYYKWVNLFTAYHPEHGIVTGDFEKIIVYSSERALLELLSSHPPEEWDYHDI